MSARDPHHGPGDEAGGGGTSERPARPAAVLLYVIALLIWIAWSASENLQGARQGLVSPFGALAGFLPFAIGAVGFLLMRWWAVVLLMGAGLGFGLLWPRADLLIGIIAAAVVVGPSALIAMNYRSRFRWKFP